MVGHIIFTDVAILSKSNISGLTSLEPIFQTILDQYGLPDDWRRPQGFQTLAKIILEQQVSLDSAHSTWIKLEQKLGKVTPESILTLDTLEMKKCYVSRQKAQYLHNLATAVLHKALDLKALSTKAFDDIQQELMAIKGIGPWTAQVYMIFAIRAEDIYPKGDVALNNSFTYLFDKDSPNEIYELSEKWSPYRTTASFLLWHHYLSRRGRVWKQ